MEQSFGADFSGVRIHADGEADQLSRALSARAFTTGQEIYFKQGEYQPDSQPGQMLLAHELTHVVQQTGQSNSTIQRFDEAAQVAFDAEMEELDNLIEQAEEAQDNSSRAYFVRVQILLSFHSNEINTLEDFHRVKHNAEVDAGNEERTILNSSDQVTYLNTDAFPETWARRYYDLLHLVDRDVDSLRSIYEQFYGIAITASENIPDAILEKGFPISYDQLRTLRRFSFRIGLASSSIEDHAIKQFAIAMLRYGRSKWRHLFIISWNLGVDRLTERIRNGELIAVSRDYTNFLENHEDALQSFPERARSVWQERSFEQFQDDITSVHESQLIAGFTGLFGSLLEILFFVSEANRIFEAKRGIADSRFSGFESEDKIIAAIKWAYYNGYFGDAGEEIWGEIQEHGWFIIGAVIVMLLALVAGHFFPPLGLSLDVILIALGGIDLIDAIDDLLTRLNAASQARSIEELQQQSGLLARALIGNGIRIILDLAGFLGGRSGISRNLARIEAESSGLTRAEALGQAIATSSEGQTVIGRGGRAGEFLTAHSGSRSARRALRIAEGEAQVAEELLQVAEAVPDVAVATPRASSRFARMTLEELQALAPRDAEAAMALVERYKTFSLSRLRQLARRRDATAQYVIDAYQTTSTQRLVDLAINGDRLAEEVLQSIWPNAHGLRRAISTVTQNRAMARQLAADLAAARSRAGITRVEGSVAQAGSTEGGTIAVGRTDLEGLQSRLFDGASAEAGGTVHPRYQPANPIYPGHAEQNLLGRVADAIEELGLTGSQIEGKTLYIRVEQTVCSSCRAGIFNTVENPGVILQFSREFPQLTIEVTAANTAEVLKIRNGAPVL